MRLPPGTLPAATLRLGRIVAPAQAGEGSRCGGLSSPSGTVPGEGTQQRERGALPLAGSATPLTPLGLGSGHPGTGGRDSDGTHAETRERTS